MTELHAEQNFKINRRARIEVTPLYGICPEILIKSELFKPFFFLYVIIRRNMLPKHGLKLTSLIICSLWMKFCTEIPQHSEWDFVKSTRNKKVKKDSKTI